MTRDIVRITCCQENCGTFPMDRALFQKLKRTGETWTCPAGHEQHFTESTEQQLREKVDRLERKVSDLRESEREWFERWRDEKARRKDLETLVLDRATGVVKVGPEKYKWACACGSRGTKAFEDSEECRDAWQNHRRREGCGNSVPEDVIEA